MARFIVNYAFRGHASDLIVADSKEAAEAQVEKAVNSDDFDIDNDEIHDVDFTVTQLHPVTRGGREMWTTFVLATDIRGHQSALDETPLFSGRLEEDE
jgi:hypothetical protein